jgi:Uma2 family endonuclease
MPSVGSSLRPQPVVLTYDDLRATPDDGNRYEILDGELHMTPAPSTTHQRISRNLEFVLHAHVAQLALGEVLDAPVDVILDRSTVVQPDLVFVASARLSIITERGIEGAPDLVVEILSPGTEQRDRGFKQQLYGRYGVMHYWRVDPSARSLTELVLNGDSYSVRATHLAGPGPITCALFPELRIDLAQVFLKPGGM